MNAHDKEIFDLIIRGIVLTRGADGATISEIRRDYMEMVGDQWPLADYLDSEIIGYLNKISGIYMDKWDNGAYIWRACGTISSELEQQTPNNSYMLNAPPAPMQLTTSSMRKQAAAELSVSVRISPIRPDNKQHNQNVEVIARELIINNNGGGSSSSEKSSDSTFSTVKTVPQSVYSDNINGARSSSTNSNNKYVNR